MSRDDLGDRLSAAVGGGDADAVRDLLESGADPDTTFVDGLSVMCAAIAAYDVALVSALVEGGADPCLTQPDGSTPLERAIDAGSPDTVAAMLPPDVVRRLSEATRERLLASARRWYARGAAGELRRRTGASGPVVSVRLLDDEYHYVDQVSLGGRTVRAGHGAILTALEWSFRVPTPVDAIIDRAIRTDEYHVDWWTACWTLSRHRSQETWSAVVAHRFHPAQRHRHFVALYLRLLESPVGGTPFRSQESGDLLAVWALEEDDGGVLARVLDTYTDHEHPLLESVGLQLCSHPDPRVRAQVPYALVEEFVVTSAAARAALAVLVHDPVPEVRMAACGAGRKDSGLQSAITLSLVGLATDPDPLVRHAAAEQLAFSSDRSATVADTLADLLGEEDQSTRLEAAYGLALRDHPRTAEAIDRVGELGVGFEHDHRASALRTWQWKRNRAHPG
ncbi:HEAT repeat domain-containing protein [Streptomyces sp. NBC_00059]|uniref:HEAT repeat domain-containing protein n=1 Tax=Streptomyces sp. NBC_00059 TaxID=2975635 RepID=UPI0022523DD3|nr:HEAT repeat domain-containing protein [Streptomyces sp. NBC_00059]MCX5415744.1 HEAT repeat domain-containing protein [Streptomyces sp. NBC_00059]